jgi:hypothetical protein
MVEVMEPVSMEQHISPLQLQPQTLAVVVVVV